MIAIIDYGMGNLRSVQKALEQVGANTIITQDPKEVQSAEKVVLPGVGAMNPAMEKLKSLGLIEPIKEAIEEEKPFLGICLGLQLLFSESEEGGGVTGLGIIEGTVRRFQSLKVPHMGWNQIKIEHRPSPLFEKLSNESYTYFCHSFYVNPVDSSIIATRTDYGVNFVSSIEKKNIFGVQFHPEKSQRIGLQILKNFQELSL